MKMIAVIIVTWNGREMLRTCLSALHKQTVHNFRVICIDNGSTDGSQEMVRQLFPSVQMIPLPKNEGFADPNNRGIRLALQEPNVSAVVTLNNDTVVAPNYLEEMIACSERHPQAGSIQPKVLRSFPNAVIDATGILIYPDMSAINRGQGEKDKGQYEKEEEVFGASASAALYTREALEDCALKNGEFFDEDYFAYYEDVDLAFRMRLRGYLSYYTPRAIVHHKHSATGKSSSPFKSFYIHRNQYFNILKNLPFRILLFAFIFFPFRYFLLFSSILRKKGPSARLVQNARGGILLIVLQSWRDIILHLPSILRKRKYIQTHKRVQTSTIQGWFRTYRASLIRIIYGETSSA